MFLLVISIISVLGPKPTLGVYYNTYTGAPITSTELRVFVQRNTTFWCLNDIKPCDPHEWRRIDGSCNNLKNPSKGAAHTPNYRLLPAVFGKDFGPRAAEDGEPMPQCRPLRTYLLANGNIPDPKFTHLFTYFLAFFSADVTSFTDSVNFVLWKPYCCEPKGRFDPDCIPNKVPDDDPVHRFSNIRCLNLTKPITYQSAGCLEHGTEPERIVTNSPSLDLSQVYGQNLRDLYEKGRLFEKGQLKYEVENGKVWPPSFKKPINICLLNQKPYETRCHDTPDAGVNSVLGINLFAIWIWRFHIQVATELSKMNPCWDDDKLFYTTRDIVIAVYLQISYYEMWPALLGRDNLIRDSVISSSTKHRQLYNENRVPQISTEFPVALRWAHTIQETNIRMYDEEGFHLKDVKMVNLTLRTGFLVENIDYVAQSAIRQGSGKIDHITDWDIAEFGLGPLQKAVDIPANDLCKNSYLGVQPYVAYKEYCAGKSYNKFEDLLDSIEPEMLELLQHKYRNVRDIDLTAGLWLEKWVKGGYAPATFYCIVVEQLIQNMVSDRHWYESEDRPHAFTYDQLQSIRKMTIARLMCDVGDSITRIQPNAFFRAGPGNEMGSCDKIEKLDLSPWKDNNCHYKPYAHYGS